jgi:L-ascorbate metabolism protein UlaG (beta-lactamase superfamily)
MRVTKLIHSCLLVDHEGKVVLVDPGQWSWESGLVAPGTIHQLDEIVITHEHADHFHLPFVQSLVEQFPKVKIITTDIVKKQLVEAGINNVTTESSNLVHVESITHESMEPLAPAPNPNLVANLFGLLTHPGDSHHPMRSEAILCVPLAGPWGATIEAVRMADRLGPHIILPIHDWMWNTAWKTSMYDRLEAYYAQSGRTFVKLIDGVPTELNV